MTSHIFMFALAALASIAPTCAQPFHDFGATQQRGNRAWGFQQRAHARAPVMRPGLMHEPSAHHVCPGQPGAVVPRATWHHGGWAGLPPDHHRQPILQSRPLGTGLSRVYEVDPLSGVRNPIAYKTWEPRTGRLTGLHPAQSSSDHSLIGRTPPAAQSPRWPAVMHPHHWMHDAIGAQQMTGSVLTRHRLDGWDETDGAPAYLW